MAEVYPGRGTVRALDDVDAWFDAWQFITAMCTARVHGVNVDQGAMLVGHDSGDVIAVLLDFVGRVLEAVGPGEAAAVCQRWGLIATGEVPDGDGR